MFCGTGIVTYMASRLGIFSKVIANDIMYYSYIMAKAMLCKKIEPISLIDKVPIGYEGSFITKNYSSKIDDKEANYFTYENAKRIDWIREQIDLIQDEDTKSYLLSSLLSASDKVANTASVYGAFLKKFKASALKDLDFIIPPVHIPDSERQVYNLSVEDFPENEHIDLLYLDPPYNCRGYDSNYHILETIALNDCPQIRGKTKLRVNGKKSNFCSKSKCKKIIGKIIEKRSASYRP